MYTAEYAKSSRSTCKICKGKIEKNALRIGKKVEMDGNASGRRMDYDRPSFTGTYWYCYECFWGPKYIPGKTDAKRNVWKNFNGYKSLSTEDQNKLHVKVTGKPLSDTALTSIENKKKTEEDQAVYADSSPDVILPALLEKYLGAALVTDLKSMISRYRLQAPKSAKKYNLIRTLMDAPLTDIPGVVYAAVDKNMTAADLKTSLSGLSLPVSGSKKVLIWRFLEANDIKKTDDVWVLKSAIEKKNRKQTKKYEYEYDSDNPPCHHIGYNPFDKCECDDY